MKPTRFLILIFTLVSCFVLFACTAEAEPTAVPTVMKSATATSTRTVTQTPTITATATRTRVPMVNLKLSMTATWKPEDTLTPTLQENPDWHQTPISSNNSTENILHDGQTLPDALVLNRYTIKDLAVAAEWGKGQIRDIAFAPDGKSFAVSTKSGYMIYDVENLDTEPKWIGFGEKFPYDYMLIDKDSAVVRFSYEHTWWDVSGGREVNEYSYYRYDSGKEVEEKDYYRWVMPLNQYDLYDMEGEYLSSDGQYKFTFSLDWECGMYGDYDDSEYGFPDPQAGTLKNLETGEEFVIGEDEPCISYKETSHPEGCDMYVFSPCGNAIADYALNAMNMDFGADGETFTLHYHWEFYFDEDSFLKIYDLETGKELFQIGDFEDAVQDFAYSPDGKKIVVAFYDGSVELWDIKRQKPIMHWHDFSSEIRYAEISSDGQYLLAQSYNVLDIYQISNGALVNRIPAVTFANSSIEPIVATSEENGTIYLRSLPDGKIINTLRGHNTFVYAMAYSPDGKYLVSSGEDCKRLLWNLETGRIQTNLDPVWVDGLAMGDTSSRMFVYYYEVIPSTNEIVGFGSWGTAGFWNMDTGEVTKIITSQALEYYNGMMTIQPHYPSQFYINQEEGYFAIGTAMFDLDTKEMIQDIEFPALTHPACYLPDLTTIDGEIEMAIGMGSIEDMYCVLDADTSELLGALDIFPKDYFGNLPIAQLLMTPDGRRIIGLTTSGTFYVFQVNK